MQQLIQKNIFWIFLIIIVLGGGIYFSIDFGKTVYETGKSNIELREKEKMTQEKLALLQAKEKEKPSEDITSGKKVFESKDMQFSTEASFAPLFEMFIDSARASGIRLRSIDYNYAPADDSIFMAKITGYNACELTVTAIGRYNQFQNFFKNMAQLPYVVSFAEMEIKPWENDKTVLISNFKLRLYTKTN